ncbi:MAG: radical SAM protein [Prochloraceae cyanobacterium]|nr:radical SAM protein [Prochloraceae cyanobacterium]
MNMNRIYQLMKLNRAIKSHRVKFAGILLLHILKLRYLCLRFDPIIACNLSCQMCYFSDKEFRKNNKGTFKSDEIERLAKMFFPRTLQVVFGCGAEPTLYKDFPKLIKLAKSYGVPYVGLVSNGQLIKEEHIRELVNYGLDELLLSVHGVRKTTYENLMTNSNYEKFHAVLNSFNSIKSELGSSTPTLRLNYTVNPDNLEELSDFFKVYGNYNINTLQVRPIMDIGQSGYRNLTLDRYIDNYNNAIDRLSNSCKERGITLLARTQDPAYKSEQEDYSAAIIDSILRYISPQRVWRTDFDWKNVTYDEFCQKIGFINSLFKGIVASKEEIINNNPFKGKLTLTYDVL